MASASLERCYLYIYEEVGFPEARGSGYILVANQGWRKWCVSAGEKHCPLLTFYQAHLALETVVVYFGPTWMLLSSILFFGTQLIKCIVLFHCAPNGRSYNSMYYNVCQGIHCVPSISNIWPTYSKFQTTNKNVCIWKSSSKYHARL